MGGATLAFGEQFLVSQEVRGADGVTFLRLSDGRGWAFDRKPGVGMMCTKAQQVKYVASPTSSAPASPVQRGAEAASPGSAKDSKKKKKAMKASKKANKGCC